MSISVCVQGLIAEGLIGKGQATEADRLYNQHFNALKDDMGMMAAASLASERTIQGLRVAALRKKRLVLLQAQAQTRWLNDMRAISGEGNALSGRAAHDAVVDMDRHRQAVRRQAYGMIDELLVKHRRNLIGEVRAKSDLNDVVDELHGRDSGSVNAKEIAEAWTKTAEWLRSRFNAAGGAIAKLDGWALPQTHDARAVREAGFDGWREAVAPLLDRAKMIDYDTGLPMGDDKLDDVLRNAWETIATEGWSDRNAGAQGVAALANRNTDHRVLHFDGPDAWRAYADQFGSSATAFDAMLSHVERMSRDIAAMERMGPNPTATVRWQGDWLEKSASLAGDQRAIDKVHGARRELERLYGEYTGTAHRPENRKLAIGFSIFRAQQTAAKLGAAVLSSGGDFGTMLTTMRFDGIPAMKALGRYVTLMNPGNMEDRALATRLGLVSSEWTNATSAQWRYTGEELTHELSRRVAEGVLRASGLSLHTEASQMAFGLEFMANLVTERAKGFDALDPAFRGVMQRYGIDAARWDTLRATPTRTERGADWFFPAEIAEHAKSLGDQGLADDVMRMIATEADYAIPVPDLRTRALINGKLPRGTWVGELGRSMFLFKGFPISILNLHGRRMLEQTGGARWKYGLTLMALTTAGGALSLQLKELAKGRDPQDMTTPRFAGAAVLQGGGIGIFGDLLGSSTDRFGGGMGRTLLGPGAQTVDNFGALTVGNAKAMLDGDEETQPEFAKRAVKAITPEVPGLSLWYIRLAYERLLGDMIAEWSDPNHAEAYARAQKYAAEQGTAYWAPPGALTGGSEPIRAPDLSNALGQPEAVR